MSQETTDLEIVPVMIAGTQYHFRVLSGEDFEVLEETPTPARACDKYALAVSRTLCNADGKLTYPDASEAVKKFSFRRLISLFKASYKVNHFTEEAVELAKKD